MVGEEGWVGRGEWVSLWFIPAVKFEVSGLVGS
jgi:hypothetical protein